MPSQKIYRHRWRKACKRASVIIVAVIYLAAFSTAKAKAQEISFTEEEMEYISSHSLLRAASIDGGAPLHYIDSKGEIKGIAVKVLYEIADIAGLAVECRLYKTIEEVIASRPDIYLGVTRQYVLPGVVSSTPYLESETILFYNKSVDPRRLGNKICAVIKGGTLPPGVDEEHAAYFASRVDTINAVDSGKADYGFGNAYSIAFYTLQNDYKNIITIPMGKEDRAYSMGVAKGNEVLLSILNKSIAAIDKNRIDTLVLDVASQIERKISVHMVMDAYGQQISALFLFIIALLSYGAFTNYRAKKQLRIENEKYEILSKLSNEYLFEYDTKSASVEFSNKLSDDLGGFGFKETLVNSLKSSVESDETADITIKLPLCDKNGGVLKMISSHLKDDKGKTHFIIGKLIDVSEEEEEKNRLILKSKLDGLTGIYNAAATKAAIIESMSHKDENQVDAFIIGDCDKLKQINDTLGHLAGNRALIKIAQALIRVFDDDDIVGRIGGDEFCVYMHDVPSLDFVRGKCEALTEEIERLKEGFPLSISIGIATWKKDMTYEQLFQRADTALYAAKQDKDTKIAFESAL